jgi:DNA polymerase III alpha subunit (gram-positive type)
VKERATYFCIDIETSGPVPWLYDVLSLGAVVVRGSPQGGFALGERFYVELRPESEREDPATRAIHGLDVDRLRREGTPRAEALARLASWVAVQSGPDTQPLFVGHNAPFDWSFVAFSFAAEGMVNPFGYKALDTKALATGVLDLHFFDSTKEVLAARLGLPPEDMGKKHRADYDAEYQAQILAALLERQQARRRP